MFNSKPIYSFDNESKTQKYQLPVENKNAPVGFNIFGF
jgi:hypothetical protein